ncbi:MAG TPA: NAD(P)-dependent oxidoreductase [Candidatus Saccharimonadales bacterium]|nr:NAD(P)-dependent oxidoreductase [Candidatus Saccharimonadales bacterium]
MRVLLTGASGFLGRRVAERLVGGGHDVVSIGRSAPDGSLPDAGRFINADLADARDVRRAAEDSGAVDSIIHLAAMVPKNTRQDDPVQAFAVNVMGTVHLFAAFGRPGQANVVASTAEVYGLPQGHEALREDAELRPRSWYGASKVAAEIYCRTLAHHDEMRVAILRLTVLYGSGDTIQRAIPNFIHSAVLGEPVRIFGGEELRDYLHVDDAAKAVIVAWQRRLSGTYNVGSGRGVAVRDAADAVVRLAGGSSALEQHPRQKPAADIVLDVTRFREATGFSPARVFPDGLEEQIARAAAADARL